MDIAEFLLARIAEDEAAARQAVAYEEDATRASGAIDDPTPMHEIVVTSEGMELMVGAVPARVLAECEAKRDVVNHLRAAVAEAERAQRMLARYGPDDREAGEYELAAVRVLQTVECIAGHAAAVYADHPDYRPEWAPQTEYRISR